MSIFISFFCTNYILFDIILLKAILHSRGVRIVRHCLNINEESVKTMKLLALGDVVSSGGCDTVTRRLPKIKREYGVDACLVNGENSAKGNGILPSVAEQLISAGADIITTGNHVFRRREIYDYIDEHDYILRPYNMHPSCPGKGIGTVDMGRYRVGVINLMGNAFMGGSCANPFDSLDNALAQLEDCKIKVVDFHAEATGENALSASMPTVAYRLSSAHTLIFRQPTPQFFLTERDI